MSSTETSASSDSGSGSILPARQGNAGDEGSAKDSRAKWAVLLIALPFAIQAGANLKILLRSITLRYDTSFPEGASIYAFLTALQTHRLYHSPFDFPWNAQLYGPLFYMVGTFFAGLLHGQPTPLTFVMRSLTFATVLGSATIIGRLCWKLEGRKTFAAITVIVSLASTWLLQWSSTVRSDLPAIFLALAALALYQASQERPWLLYLAGVVGFASMLTKQSTAAVLLALFIDCFWTRGLKKAAILLTGAVTTGLLILGPLWLHHEPFWANFTLQAFTVRDVSSIKPALRTFLNHNELAVVAMMIAYLGAALCWKKISYRAILLATVFAWFSNVAALAYIGGSENYLILPWFLTVLFVPAGLKQLERWGERRSLWDPIAVFVLASIVVINQKRFLSADLPAEVNDRPAANWTMLTDLSYLELRSREPQLLDPFLYNEFARQKLWSDAPILNRIDGEHYDLLLLVGQDGDTDSQFFVSQIRGTSTVGADVLAEVTRHYRTICEIDNHLALVPLSRANPVTSADLAKVFNEPCAPTSRHPEVVPGSL